MSGFAQGAVCSCQPLLQAFVFVGQLSDSFVGELEAPVD